MYRCLELAELASGHVAPNPMVGAVLVHENRIIGEGYHQQYGKPHAEVNCIGAVAEKDQKLIARSTLYVSLEPCAHFGKTPPCADLIIRHRIPQVVIGCRDPFKEVDGKGIGKLKAAGIEVVTGVLERECRNLNRRFFTFHEQERPYIILKWAQTADHFMGTSQQRLLISNEYSNRLVHKWRSEEAAILVGTHTALLDDPALTNRLWQGPSPVRLVLDRDLRLPQHLKIFNREVPTIIFNSVKEGEERGLRYYRLVKNENIIGQLMSALYKLNIQSVLVEGGARLLQSFINEGIWDEARVIANQELRLGEKANGLQAPGLANALPVSETKYEGDRIRIFKKEIH